MGIKFRRVNAILGFYDPDDLRLSASQKMLLSGHLVEEF